MEERNLKVLEYDKILNRLAKKAVCPKTAEMIEKLRPVTDINEAKMLLAETDEAERYMVKHLEPPIIPLNDITAAVKRAKVGAVLSCKELLDISRVLRVARLLKNYVDDSEGEWPILRSVTECILKIPEVENEIDRCILSEDEVASNATKELAEIRAKRERMSDKIRDVLNEMVRAPKYQTALQESLITTRSGRFVLPVKAEYKGAVPGIVHDASASGATVFIEPMQVVEINNEIHKLNALEKDEIEKILTSLTQNVEDHSRQIEDNYKYILKADLIFSRARLSIDMDASIPELNDKGIIDIKKGRHPLLDKDKAVPIDVYLGRDFDTLVITGPNTGGKTVTLKTIGLFTLMAQTGLNIPAAYGSVLSVFTEVFADIGDEQSIEQSLSTFSSHMVNIVNILNKADERSLVLFDELGAGTDPAEGAALAVSILEYVKMCGAKTAATTHYSEIKLYALSTKRVENAACEFDVATLRPTYKLLIGVPGKSNAFAIASKLGVSDYIIERAKEQLSAENIRFEDVVSELEADRTKAERAKDEAEKLKRENEEAKEKIRLDREKIERQKDELLKDARREAKLIIKNAQRKTDALIKEAVKAMEAEDKSKAKKAAEEARRKLSEAHSAIEDKLAEEVLTPKNNKIPKKLRLGQEVEVLSMGQRATVMTLPDSKGNLIVQAGILKVTTNISGLKEIIDKPQYSKKQKTQVRSTVSKTESAVTELDLRGQMADEALLNLEKFIDDAVLANLETVRVIHGKGTGVLRNTVHQFCKKSKQVKDYRLGVYGEGENGVTVITLK